MARNRAWVVALLLVLLGALVLWWGARDDCLSIAAGVPSGSSYDMVCQTSVAPGAVVFTGICWLTALIVWLLGRRG